MSISGIIPFGYGLLRRRDDPRDSEIRHNITPHKPLDSLLRTSSINLVQPRFLRKSDEIPPNRVLPSPAVIPTRRFSRPDRLSGSSAEIQEIALRKGLGFSGIAESSRDPASPSASSVGDHAILCVQRVREKLGSMNP